MMRSKYLALPLLAALALPVVAQAEGLLRKSSCDSCGSSHGRLFGGGCGAGGCGHGGHGGHGWGNAPAQYSTKNGLGLFQPPFQASPWYLYWPYDQHFQMAAPIGAPFTPPQHLHTPFNPYFGHPTMGPVGPHGPHGPQGPQGPQGVPSNGGAPLGYTGALPVQPR